MVLESPWIVLGSRFFVGSWVDGWLQGNLAGFPPCGGHPVGMDHRKKDVLPTAKKSLAVKGDLT